MTTRSIWQFTRRLKKPIVWSDGYINICVSSCAGLVIVFCVIFYFRFQKPLTILVRCGGLVTRNYFIRFVFYLIISVPCCFVLPTLLGGMCYLITSAIYFVAALKGEEWKPAGLDTESQSQQPGPRVLQPPSHPPPRRPIDNSI
ncbi:cytochrome b-245 light chain-like isoform X2 [Haliotis rufescens]|uniref:cytochrome b-245 light chain-like isoform X2 n=1 Tax=Haliotis rufescens TaxID=6454 RepID=UPI00201EA640|nr:cytochrome b-245 light chain-like isoform X2 [Haliotis rufescens]